MKIPSDSIVTVHLCQIDRLYYRAFAGDIILCYHDARFTENPEDEITSRIPPEEVFGERCFWRTSIGNHFVPPDKALGLYHDILNQEGPKDIMAKQGLPMIGSIDDAVRLHRQHRPDLYDEHGQPFLREQAQVLVHKGFGRLEAEDYDDEEEY